MWKVGERLKYVRCKRGELTDCNKCHKYPCNLSTLVLEYKRSLGEESAVAKVISGSSKYMGLDEFVFTPQFVERANKYLLQKERMLQ